MSEQQLNPAPDDLSRAARNMGIASFFFGMIILSLLTIKLASTYKKNNGGRHCGQSKAAMICGIASLVIWTGIIAWAVIAFWTYTDN